MIRITKDPKDAKDKDEEAIATRSILRSIFSRTEHWREIDLQLPTNVMTPDMVSTLQDSKTCSRLEFANVMFKSHDSNLLLLHHWEWGNDVYMEFWKFFSQSPSLCRVGWTYCPQEIILADTQRDQLTQVSLFSSVYLQGLITLLIHAQSLVWLSSFIFRGIDTTSSIPSGTVDLNRLHTLKVDFGCERISTLLDYITCPSLRDLEIASSLSNDQALSDSDSFRQFLSRSRCQVNDLSLGGGGYFCENHNREIINSVQLAQYLTANGLQSLKSLKLMVSSISTSALRLLASQLRDSPHFPESGRTCFA